MLNSSKFGIIFTVLGTIGILYTLMTTVVIESPLKISSRRSAAVIYWNDWKTTTKTSTKLPTTTKTKKPSWATKESDIVNLWRKQTNSTNSSNSSIESDLQTALSYFFSPRMNTRERTVL